MTGAAGLPCQRLSEGAEILNNTAQRFAHFDASDGRQTRDGFPRSFQQSPETGNTLNCFRTRVSAHSAEIYPAQIVGLADTSGALLDEWIFGDGAEFFLPAQPFMLHVYQNPGTYTCELGLVNAQGITTTVFTTITVKPAG